ncbi:hypothetical protein BDZ91DRAFT_720777 [Kalaharituber pfeilii]|nr:hypothetical protein BDZ91DRAFT_720777 [Kalaharituber pfeilii]
MLRFTELSSYDVFNTLVILNFLQQPTLTTVFLGFGRWEMNRGRNDNFQRSTISILIC